MDHIEKRQLLRKIFENSKGFVFCFFLRNTHSTKRIMQTTIFVPLVVEIRNIPRIHLLRYDNSSKTVSLEIAGKFRQEREREREREKCFI